MHRLKLCHVVWTRGDSHVIKRKSLYTSFFPVSLFCILVTVFEYKNQVMVSHQQAQPRDRATSTIIHHLLFSATATMANFFTTCTSSNVLALFSLTVCVMLATSAPTVDVRRATSDRRDIFYNTTDLVSSNIYNINSTHGYLVHC